MKRLNYSLRDMMEIHWRSTVRTTAITLVKSSLIMIVIFSFLKIEAYSEGKLIFGNNTLVNREVKLDINYATKEEMLRQKIPMGQISKIHEYREITGGFRELFELKRISGIGPATYDKLSAKFKVDRKFIPKRYNINRVDDKALIYLGYSKEEIKNLRKHISQNGKIHSNIELMKIIPKKKYERQRDYIDY